MRKAPLRLECRIVSSLEKIFLDRKLKLEAPFPEGKIPELDAARGETCAFQIVLKCRENIFLKFSTDPFFAKKTVFREVLSIPCALPANPRDKNMLRSAPGLYPDPLSPLEKPMRLYAGLWQSVWVSVKIPENMEPGLYEMPVTVDRFQYLNDPLEKRNDLSEDLKLRIRVHEAVLPKQKLICTNWFYADSLSEYYHVKVWSEKFWKILENYISDYAAHGRNMLMTPLWTVPLDTQIGGERPAAQLLDIVLKNGKYTFDFSRLKRWIDLGRKCGIEYFEMSHFFTQWGAKAVPKIIVRVNGKKVKKFGWHTPSTGREYRDFLDQLLPELLRFLSKEKLRKKCFFHFSDEPEERMIEDYRKASAPLRKYLKEPEFPVIDALSSAKYFREGLVRRPVPHIAALNDFRSLDIPHRWCYFCGNFENYPQRSYGTPLCHYRILGVLLFLYRMEGFLHWGHNFWFSQYSRNALNPWIDTTAGRGFTGGNSYNVYPGGDLKPVDSLHYESFMEAMQDLRLLELLEQKIGFEECCKVICKDLDYVPEMNHFPQDAAWLPAMRKRVFAALEENANGRKIVRHCQKSRGNR